MKSGRSGEGTRENPRVGATRIYLTKLLSRPGIQSKLGGKLYSKGKIRKCETAKFTTWPKGQDELAAVDSGIVDKALASHSWGQGLHPAETVVRGLAFLVIQVYRRSD